METLEEYIQQLKKLPDWELEGILRKIDKEKFPDRCIAVELELKSRQNPPSVFIEKDDTPVYAGFGRRFGAYLIDWVLYCLLVWVLGNVIGLFIRTPDEILDIHNKLFSQPMPSNFIPLKDPHDQELARTYFKWVFQTTLLFSFLTYVCAWLPFVWMESLDGQGTPGKILLRIKVTSLQGRRISLAQAFGRNVLKLLSTVMLGMGFIPVLFTRKKQAFHDSASGCVIIRRAG